MILAILNFHASRQVLAQSDLLFERICGSKNFKMVAIAAILDIIFIISITSQCLQSSLSSIQLTVWEQMKFEDFQDGCYGGHLEYQDRTILAILNLDIALMPSIKF